MTDDLVKRLRHWARFGYGVGAAAMNDAASRIEKLEGALRTVKEWHGYGLPLETTRIIDAALEGKDV